MSHVAAGVAIDATDTGGDTALHSAAAGGHLEIVEYLVGQGASLTATNNDGKTAKDVTAIAEYLDSVGAE